MNNRKLFNDKDELESSMFNYINLQKDNKTSLKIEFEGESNILNDSLIIFDSLDSEIDFDGKIKITKTNHIFLENLLNNFYIFIIFIPNYHKFMYFFEKFFENFSKYKENCSNF